MNNEDRLKLREMRVKKWGKVRAEYNPLKYFFSARYRKEYNTARYNAETELIEAVLAQIEGDK